MHLAKVIGTVWATRKVETLEGAKMQIIQPLDAQEKAIGSPIVAVDTIGAGPGEIVYYVTAREAVIPYRNEMTPIDASIVGIVDHIDVYAKQE
ncbi:MAG: EutN/CcmL family microcompartment protein [Deferribacteres bacterium]|nr:EutN/CcmL family microcompartment protein [candidate division KSB1 bacterium]MCB9508764.1 EutN/CcmL family microcompartment protein [Deferribacteres bacterium]